MTHSEELKAQFDYNRKQVLWLTKLSEEQYSNFQIDTAKAFVEMHFAGVINIDQLLDTKLFWKWWNYMWNDADDKWILHRLYHTREGAYCEYRIQHQYVFDQKSADLKLMLQDFRSMRPAFDEEIKQQKVIA